MVPFPKKVVEAGLLKPALKAINDLREYVQTLTPRPGKGIKISHTNTGAVFDVDSVPVQSSSSQVKRFTVVSVGDDTLTCVPSDNLSGSQVTVAKPFNLRKTGWHNATVSYQIEAYPGAPTSPVSILYSFISSTYRTARMTIGSATSVEHQVIVPRYVANFSEIVAAQSENGTGVSGVEWVEVGSARSWARIV